MADKITIELAADGWTTTVTDGTRTWTERCRWNGIGYLCETPDWSEGMPPDLLGVLSEMAFDPSEACLSLSLCGLARTSPPQGEGLTSAPRGEGRVRRLAERMRVRKASKTD